MPSLPVALSLAGSDCSAGAGLQADLKTFTHLQVYGLTVPTSVVAEVPGLVAAVQPLPPGLVTQQLDLLLAHYPVAALKTGLLGSPEIIEALLDCLSRFPGPVVVDPVSLASSGHALAAPGYSGALRRLVTASATLVTPNRPEAEAWLGQPIPHPDQAPGAAQRLAADLGCSVLLKGGHFPGPTATDWLVHPGGLDPFSRPRLPGPSLHGTGCTLSAAITAFLARGRPLPEAVHHARDFLHQAIAHAYSWPRGENAATKALAHSAPRVQT